MFRRVFDALLTAVALILSIPTILILISWNAIPGDRLYPLKSGLEDITLLLFSGTPLVPEVSMKFTERRFNEATTLLSKRGSSVGYSLLLAEAQQTQSYIVKKKDGASGTQFIQNIEEYQQEIGKKKAELLVEAQPEPASQLPAPTEQPVVINLPDSSVSQTTGQEIIVNKPETVVIREENPEEVLQSLVAAETELENIKQEVEEEIARGELQSGDRKSDNNEKDKGKDKNNSKKDGDDDKDDNN